ncbi:cache domain-containing protein [Geotalea sp. SG265]|uniref:cache domain-containing protein n=1 Tax=Geotalea sp. SG265 TaxID=2922867 RepID=UPI001FB0128D|nr:cache domain-containing protein [Geotalea sp. SG265]
MAFKIEKVRRKLFIPLVMSMLLFLCGLIYTVYRLQWDHIQADTESRLDAFHKNYQYQIQNETDLLNGFLVLLKENESLQRAWLSGDRQAVLHAAQPIFDEIRKRSLITHFYFITSDKKCFLRVHKPDAFGDMIDRTTLDIAAHLGKPANGIEMGPYGTVALRSVHPWFIKGRLAGYLELGEDVEQLTARISKLMNMELISVVDKKFLDKGKWEQGLKMSGRYGDWDQYKHYVVVSTNNDRKYPGLDRVLDVTETRTFMMNSGGRRLNGGFDASIDAAGNIVGKFVLFSDVSREERSIYNLLLRLGLLTLAISGLALAFFDWYIKYLHHKENTPPKETASAVKEP